MGEKGDEAPEAVAAPQGLARLIPNARVVMLAAGAVIAVAAALLVVRSITGDDETKVSTKAARTTTPPAGSSGTQAPDPASLPAGAILIKGDSGDNIGFIAQDGQSRFLSLTGPGVAKGDLAGRDIAVAWDHGAGKIISFAANLHTTDNKGRYGINPFRNVSASGATTGTTAELYKHGCAIEVGQTSCRADHNTGTPIENGDKISIIIGEEGHLDATGDFSVDWWFVFLPG
jgi:hypothetical protein